MIIHLHPDWDNIPSGNNRSSPYFSGRENELRLIKHIILSKSSGSILIGAARGTGKTDLIYKSVEESIEQLKKEKIQMIPVVFNATQLMTSTVERVKLDPKTILVNLITRIYTVCKQIDPPDKELMEDISVLYFQATAKDYEISLMMQNQKENFDKVDESHENLTGGYFSINKKNLTEAIRKIIPPALISASFITNNYLSLFNQNYALGIYFVFMSIYFASQIIDFSFEKKDITSTKSIKGNSKNLIEVAKTMYLRDNSLSNLEFELKEFIQKINMDGRGLKLLFVIDELDKVPNESNNVIETIKIFKGLFNHSDALFFFIADQNTFETVSKARESRDVDINSTLFTQRIYINRPQNKDMKTYLGKIIKSPSSNVDDFKDFIIYSSRMDFYRISDVIRDHIKFKVDSDPTIQWEPSGTNLQIVRKQEVITALLEDGGYLYEMQSDLSKNEALIEEAYSVTTSRLPIEFPLEINNKDSVIQDTSLVNQLRRDVCKYLEIIGIFQKTTIEREEKKYEVFTPTKFSGKPLGKLNQFLEFEKEFLNSFKDFKEFILDIYNFKIVNINKKRTQALTEEILQEVNQLIGDISDIYNGSQEIVEEMNKNITKHPFGQEELKIHIDDIKSIKMGIIQNKTLDVIKHVLESNSLVVQTLSDGKEILDSMPTLQSFITDKSIKNLLVKSSDEGNNKLLIILLNAPISLVTVHTILDELNNNKNVYILDLYDETLEPRNIKEPRIKAKQLRDFRFNKQDFNYLIKRFIKK